MAGFPSEAPKPLSAVKTPMDSHVEAAQIVVRVLSEAHSPALTLADLQERTGLPTVTVEDFVERLRKNDQVQTSKDGHGTVWVSADRI